MLSRTLPARIMFLLLPAMIFCIHAARSQEYFRGMVQLFGNDEGAAFITSPDWTPVTKTSYSDMDGSHNPFFPPAYSGTVREYYLLIKKADDVNDCGAGPLFRFWFPHMGKAGHEFVLNRDWGSIHAGTSQWVKVPTNNAQVNAVYSRDGVSGTYQDFYFRLDARMPPTCAGDRSMRIFSIHLVAIDKVGGAVAPISLNNDPVGPGIVRNTFGSTSGVLAVRDDKVGIGTHNPVSELAVNGAVTAKKVKVTNAGWADFVFADTYQLRPLEEVEQFIKTNRHLPDVPSEKEVMEKGNDLGETDKKLLQKIEELTLYLIELKKENQEIKKELKALKEK